MTGSGSGAPGRDMTAAPAPRRGIGRPILIAIAIGLVFRLIMAYGVEGLRGSGFESDLALFRYWAEELARNGPFGFYERDFFADYTPGYLYVLWLVGIVGQLVGGVGDLIKLPAIITDVALGLVVYRMALDLGASERRATIAGALVIANPITWFDSVIWGQVDSFGTVFLLLAIRELWKGRGERAAILAVVAALIKPQLAILVPIVALVVIRRSLWPSGGWGDEPAPAPSGTDWERHTTGPVRILTTGAAGFLTAVAMSLPFGLAVVSFSTAAPFVDSSLVRLILSTAATYSFVTVNAYNAWALFEVNGQSLASNGQWIADAPIPDVAAWAAIGPLPAAAVGAALLLVVMLVTSLLVARRPDRLTILVGTAVLALAFFAVPTRVHERYLFPLFGLAGILFACSWRWRIAYLVAGTATFLNMYVVLTTLYPGNPSVSDWLGIGPAIRSWTGVAIVAVLHTLVLAWGLAQLRPAARRALAEELEAARTDDAGPGGEPAVPAPAPLAAPPAPAPASPAPPPSLAWTGPAARAPTESAGRRRVPAWFERPSLAELGPVGWLRARLSETPTRPDRSHELEREGRGRLDRMDLFLVLLIVVAALGLRTFRLGEPARMHFDEVYHARTATEFLQAWRYGISHNIYEWTHPHLAKYAMAGGIVLFAGHDVRATSDLGVPVRDATIEPRRESTETAGARDGDRVWVVTGEELIGYDLETRDLAARWAIPGASAVAFAGDGDQLLVGTDAGEILVLDALSLDVLRGASPTEPPVEPFPLTTLDGPIARLAAFDGGQRVAALLPGDVVAVVDVGLGEETGRATVAGAADLLDAGTGDAIVAHPVEVTDPAAVADELAAILGGDAASYAADLADPDAELVVIDGELTADVRTALQDAIDGGRLPGVLIDKVAQLAVAGSDGVSFLAADGTRTAIAPVLGGTTSLALVSGVDEGTQLWATSTNDTTGVPEVSIVAVSGDQAKEGPGRIATIELPGAGSRIVFDQSAELVEVLGETPDGAGTTVYVIEPHGRSVFADHRLPFVPVAMVLDHEEAYPTGGRGEILAFAADGATASLDVGHYPFAWRLPGVLLGALMAALVYLLTRVLFRRRGVAVLAGLFVLLDGMSFVQSRIAMNDVYTGVFILAAYALFAWLWLEPRRRLAFWTLMPVVGLLLGLALASKWVAAYAIGALGILVLVRSALGRLILVAALIGLTGVLGWMALAVPADSGGSGNLVFALIMIGLTMGAVVVAVYHPVAWSAEEMWFAVAAPAALGILVFLGSVALGRTDMELVLGPVRGTPLTASFALVVAGLGVYAAFVAAGRLGIGPLARDPEPGDARYGIPPASPPAEGWLRLGTGLGLPVAWLLGSLVAIPVVVYVISYIPWALIENHQLWDGWPPDHTGQTLLTLVGDMYRYHNNLSEAHAASSPWWAWPLNLKPVWFYQGSFAGSTAAAIYDAGNVVIWWLGVPAMAFVAYQAFRRRSLALALILIGFLAQWISWARIDRAAFQYHYYTSLPFVVMALAYLVAEVWHGASRRTWLLVRCAAAVALMGPVILWLLRMPLCTLANVQAVNEDSAACVLSTAGSLVVTPSVAAMVTVGVVTMFVLVRQLVALGRPRDDGRPLELRDLGWIAATAVAGGALLAGSRMLPAEEPLFSMPGIVPELIALVVAVPLGLVALQVATARDARRFVVGLVAGAGIWFLILYPNIAALPLPSTLVNAYQGLLPTYLYPFQFSVNTIDRSGAISFADARFAVLMLFLVVASAVVAYSAWVWRASLGAGPADDAADGPATESGAA